MRSASAKNVKSESERAISAATMARPAYVIDFERPLIALESKIAELKQLSGGAAADFGDEILKLEKKAKKLQAEIFSDLSRWQIVQLARHPNRPYFLDYLGLLFTDFFEIEGDRRFAADHALVSGFALFDGEPVVVMGQQKGRSTKDNMYRNFGMMRPEGYRKARRLFDLAERFRRPVIIFIDTPGAYPGIGAEERGQAEAIAVNLEVMSSLSVPELAFVQITDPAAPRYAIDRDPDGLDTLFGTVSRNLPEERRALGDGLAPGQVRRGLRMLARVLEAMEQFCSLIGKEIYLIDPLFYHSAILYERHGCGYLMGREIMEGVHEGFAPGGGLAERLDGSSPFRQPQAARTVRGRSWALHDGVTDHPWGGVKMYKAAGRDAQVSTFPGALY